MSESAPNRVLTIGEACVLLDPVADGGAELGALFRMRVSGSEANVAIGLSRLGVPTRWASKLGPGPIGDLILRTLVEEGVDVSFVGRDPSSWTGMTLKLRERGSTSLVYYRRGSAASRLEPSDLPDAALDGVRLVDLSGITPALGPGPRTVVESIAHRARNREIPITFDLNYRPALWDSPAQAAAAARSILPLCQWVLAGHDEAKLLFGGRDHEDVLARVREAWARAVVLRIGAEGALVQFDRAIVRVPAPSMAVMVDEIGAGDAFDAGFIFGIVNGWTAPAAAELGNVLAVRAMAGTGDWETLPRLRDLGIIPGSDARVAS
jgi:2-dehydro-3-deoxygluconokinase